MRFSSGRLGRLLLALFLAVSGFSGAARGAEGGSASAIEEAFIYAYPLFEMARTRYQASFAAPGEASALNRLVHRRQLSDHTDRWVTTPNNDTLYSSAFLDLGQSAVEIATPDYAGRYFSVAFMDAFSNNFAVIGSRTTGTQPQHYLLAGPSWHGRVPAGATLIRAPGDWVWVLVRSLIQGPADLAAVHRLQDGISLRVVEPFQPTPPIAPLIDDAGNFLAVVNQALAHNPPPVADRAILERLARVGVGVGLPAPDAALLAAWQAALPRMKLRLRDLAQAALPSSVRAGWTYSPPTLGNFGSDYALRAIVALVGLAALEPAEAIYSTAVSDQDGAPLSGERHYRWHLPAEGLPVDAFWSLSAYEVTPAGALFFSDNPIHRYAIGDRTSGLHRNADGSLDILIQHAAPTEATANWLPIPAGPVRLVLRAYQPRAVLLKGEYRFPTIERQP